MEGVSTFKLNINNCPNLNIVSCEYLTLYEDISGCHMLWNDITCKKFSEDVVLFHLENGDTAVLSNDTLRYTSDKFTAVKPMFLVGEVKESLRFKHEIIHNTLFDVVEWFAKTGYKYKDITDAYTYGCFRN